ncbi:hypothetical protein DID78_00950 [Candidatus Marinamargulisbacteria bacterium SCGC AG-343-D04]|nr:hypothetical protein DID78_00950 [Candidatus Marinamargulisbacteria bacterium SCGC AG-343-D04]
MINKISVVVLGSILVVIFYVLFFFEVPIHFPKEKSGMVPDFMFENVRISHINDGVLEVEVEAENAVIYKGTQDVLLDKGKGTFFFSEGDYLKIDFPVGSYNLQRGAMDLNDAYMVYMRDVSPLWIYSEKIRCVFEDRFIESRSSSTIYYENIKIHSNFLAFNLDKNRVLLKDHASVNIELLP